MFAQPSPSDAPVDDDDARRASGRAATPSGAVADFVFVVESPRRWHAENMARNPTHYAPHVRLLGPTFAASLADSVGAGVHYNTLLPWNLPTNPLGFTAYKYGVVSADAARDDLLHWRHLFLAGRMQKPVASLGRPDPDVAAAADVNLRAALAAALLVLPERFPVENLHRALCGLSYRGDVRVALGAEDARKIERIARGSAGALERLYRPATDALADSRWVCARRRRPGARARGGVRIRARRRARRSSRRFRDARCRRWARQSRAGRRRRRRRCREKEGTWVPR